MQLRRSSCPTRAGFSLLETTIGITVVMIGLLAMTSTSYVAHSLQEGDKARRLANNALQRIIEQVQASSSALRDSETGWGNALQARYAPGGIPGNTFPVQDLTPWDGQETVGSVWVVTDETLTDAELGVHLGMPRDLNGDGVVNSNDVRSDATLLPVVVRLRWMSQAGRREIVHGFYALGL